VAGKYIDYFGWKVIMKQLLNLIFWCLTLCTLAISQATSPNCGSNGQLVSYLSYSFCSCNQGWMPRDPYLIGFNGCSGALGSDCLVHT
jgi:hypothetical protein